MSEGKTPKHTHGQRINGAHGIFFVIRVAGMNPGTYDRFRATCTRSHYAGSRICSHDQLLVRVEQTASGYVFFLAY